MPYAKKCVKDIPKWLICPLCGDYETKQSRFFINHFTQCKEYVGHIDDVLQYDIDQHTTIGDFLEQQLNCINITRKLIDTDELNAIATRTSGEIRLYLKNKLLETIEEYSSIELDILNIYEFFCGKSEESFEEYVNKCWIWMNNPQ